MKYTQRSCEVLQPTDVLEADASYVVQDKMEGNRIVNPAGRRLLFLDDGSTIPTTTLDFDECFKYLGVVHVASVVKKLVEKLNGRGNRHVPKCNWADHRYGGYYGASVYEKIELLQF